MPKSIGVDVPGQTAALRIKAQALLALHSPEARIIAQLLIETADMMDLIIEACAPRTAIVH